MFVGWRFLGTEPDDVAFNVYRAVGGGGEPVKLNAEPIKTATHFVDRAAKLDQPLTYSVRAVLAGWGVSVVPELLARGLVAQGDLVNIAPQATLPIQLYWHCWNLASEVLDQLSAALTQAALQSLSQPG